MFTSYIQMYDAKMIIIISIINDDYIDGANHSLPAIFTLICHMFLTGPPPFYAPPPRLM